MKTNVLKKIGLTENEINLYLELIKANISTTGPLIHSLGISSSLAYASLEKLVKRGLVSYFIKNNVRYYKAESPELILSYIKNIKEEASKTVEELKKIKISKSQESYSAIFEGFNGFKQAFDILINETSRDDEIFTIGFSPRAYAFETLRIYLKKVDNIRIKKKTKMKIILPLDMKETIGKDREEEKYTEVRYLPKGYMNPAALNIFKDYVIHWVWSFDNVTAFLIKNKEVSDSFKNHFNILWNQSKKSK